MNDDFTIHGAAVLAFGTVDETWGFAESSTLDDEAEKLEIKNGQNAYQCVIFSAFKNTVQLELSMLESGKTIWDEKNLCGKKLALNIATGSPTVVLIDKASRKLSKGKEATFSVSATIYPQITLGQADVQGGA